MDHMTKMMIMSKRFHLEPRNSKSDYTSSCKAPRQADMLIWGPGDARGRRGTLSWEPDTGSRHRWL